MTCGGATLFVDLRRAVDHARAESDLPDFLAERILRTTCPSCCPWCRSRTMRASPSSSAVRQDFRLLTFDMPSMRTLPAVRTLAGRLGLAPPLWRHTARLRRGLSFLGIRERG